MNQVGRYQLQEELGRGAIGVVYKALDPAIGRTVAIKAIRLADFKDPEERERLRERLLREAQAAGLLSHPNIVTIYDVLEKEEFAYIFMEYVEGESLDAMLKKGLLPLQLMQFLRQIADALDYAHLKGIVHRDIKPANIIISPGGPGVETLAKIADFGVARFVSHDTTHNGTVIGTPSYMSPEQIQGTTVDGRSDQFSFGVLVYEALTGARPFRADDLPALFYAICKQDPQPPDQVNPNLSAAAAKVLQRALMKDPNQRFASCGAFIGALSIALAEAPAPESSALDAAIDRALATEAVAAARSVPIISIPAEPTYELPTRARRRLGEDDFDRDRPERGWSGTKKLALIVAMCFAIGAAIVFIVLSNSGPSVPVQVLDTKAGPMTPPPQGMDIPSPARTATGESTAFHTAQNRPRQELTHPANRSQTGVAGPIFPARGGDVNDVELLTEPPGAKIVVDGRPDLTCSAPCTLSLPNGRHTLTAELAGYNIARRIFNIPSDTSVFVNLGKSMGVVVVTSSLSGCTVLVDGRPSGYTPATLHLTAGSHRIAVVSKMSRHEETVEVDTDGFDVEKFLCQ